MSTSIQLVGLLVFALAAAILWFAISKTQRGESEPRRRSDTPRRAGRPSSGRRRADVKPSRPAPVRPIRASEAAEPTGGTVTPIPSAGADPDITPVKSAAQDEDAADSSGLPSDPSPMLGWPHRRIDIELVPAAPEDLTLPFLEPGAREGIEGTLGRAQEAAETLSGRQSILEGLHGQESDPRRLSELVARDPVLTAQVLKAVNSPYYGLLKPVGSVFRAILLMGHVEVRNLIWRVCFNDVTGGMDEEVRKRLDDLWDHSFAVSRVAYAIGKELSLSRPDEIATAGLLHDVGKLIALSAWPEDAQLVYPGTMFSRHDVLREELERFKLGHAQIGARMITAWDLPTGISDAIEYHHYPSYIGPDEVTGESKPIGVVHLADLLCHMARQEGSPSGWELYRPRDGWLEELGLPDGLGRLLDQRVLGALEYRPAA